MSEDDPHYERDSLNAVLSRMETKLENIEGNINKMDTKISRRIEVVEDDVTNIKTFNARVKVYIGLITGLGVTIVEAFKSYIESFGK